jgi:hypothetical protein
MKVTHALAICLYFGRILHSWRMRIPLSYYLIHSFRVSTVCFHIKGVVFIKVALSIQERVAVVELIRAAFTYTTLYVLNIKLISTVEDLLNME